MGESKSEESKNDEKLDAGDCDDTSGANGKTKRSKTNLSADNDNDSSDEEQGNDDGDDATGLKLKSRKMDETEYDDPDDVEELTDGVSSSGSH